MIRTKLHFLPSPTLTVVEYLAKFVLITPTGPQTPPSINHLPIQHIAPTQNDLVIEAEEGQRVGLLLAAVDDKGNQSQAVHFEFPVQKFVPPLPPGNTPSVVILEAVTVADSTPANPEPPTGAEGCAGDCGGGCACTNPDDQPTGTPADENYMVELKGHPEIVDGAMGMVTGADGEGFTLQFEVAAVKPNGGSTQKILWAEALTYRPVVYRSNGQDISLAAFREAKLK